MLSASIIANTVINVSFSVFVFDERFHQVNSWSNDNGMNVAVNVWFEHKLNHRPKKCKISPDEATLDKFVFSDLERQKREAADGGEGAEKGEGGDTML